MYTKLLTASIPAKMDLLGLIVDAATLRHEEEATEALEETLRRNVNRYIRELWVARAANHVVIDNRSVIGSRSIQEARNNAATGVQCLCDELSEVYDCEFLNDSCLKSTIEREFRRRSGYM